MIEQKTINYLLFLLSFLFLLCIYFCACWIGNDMNQYVK